MTISQYIAKHNLTWAQFAAMLNVARGTLYTWQTKQRQPRVSNILKLEQITKGQIRYEDFAP
jgi:DNA-binding transcriptional regulator YiaG